MATRCWHGRLICITSIAEAFVFSSVKNAALAGGESKDGIAKPGHRLVGRRADTYDGEMREVE